MENLFHFEHKKMLNMFHRFKSRKFFYHKKKNLLFFICFLVQLRFFLNKIKILLNKKNLNYTVSLQKFWGYFKIIHRWPKNDFLSLENNFNHRNKKLNLKKLFKDSSFKSYLKEIRNYEKKQDFFKTNYRKKYWIIKKLKKNRPVVLYFYPKYLSSLEKSISFGNFEKSFLKKRDKVKISKSLVIFKYLEFNRKFYFNLKKIFYFKNNNPRKICSENNIFFIFIKNNGIIRKNKKRKNNFSPFFLEILIFFKKNQNIFYLVIFNILYRIFNIILPIFIVKVPSIFC